MGVLLATFAVVFAVDRFAKAWAFRGPIAVEGRLVGRFVTILPVRNARPRLWPTGTVLLWCASFGVGLAAALLLVMRAPDASALLPVGLGAVLGGALGNLYDRIRHGAILDFLHIGVGGVFNPADVALVLGLVIVLASRIEVATSLLSKG
jgi:lipoprotein signal peptidase